MLPAGEEKTAPQRRHRGAASEQPFVGAPCRVCLALSCRPADHHHHAGKSLHRDYDRRRRHCRALDLRKTRRMNAAASSQEFHDGFVKDRSRLRHSRNRGEEDGPSKADRSEMRENGANMRPGETRILIARVFQPVLASFCQQEAQSRRTARQ
jgi:hypothetical protein